MSALMNPHHETAASLIDTECSNGGTFLDPNTQGMMLAQAEATLALAYEQRTANLIALWGMSDDACMAMDTASGTGEADWSSVAKQIRERLGLA